MHRQAPSSGLSGSQHPSLEAPSLCRGDPTSPNLPFLMCHMGAQAPSSWAVVGGLCLSLKALACAGVTTGLGPGAQDNDSVRALGTEAKKEPVGWGPPEEGALVGTGLLEGETDPRSRLTKGTASHCPSCPPPPGPCSLLRDGRHHLQRLVHPARPGRAALSGPPRNRLCLSPTQGTCPGGRSGHISPSITRCAAGTQQGSPRSWTNDDFSLSINK